MFLQKPWIDKDHEALSKNELDFDAAAPSVQVECQGKQRNQDHMSLDTC